MSVSSYIDVNAVWGNSPYSQSDFPTLESILKHMDYLQIDRAVAWHRAAADYNPHAGNKLTLNEIDASAEAKRRLIPALVVTPASAYEFGEIENLRNALKTRRAKIIRICPKTSRFPMYQLQRVLESICEFSPCILWDIHSECGNPNDVREFGELAAKFPSVNFIVTCVMWNNLGNVLDLMWRHANVNVDTSWLHVRDSIELLTKEFGAKRILFGLGWKSHYGASIAELNFADISAHDRELIAHGNAERLFNLPAAEKPLYNNISDNQKPLWEKFRNGEMLHDIDIIDAHAHSGPHARCWYLRETSLADYIDALEAKMYRIGIKKIIITPESGLFGHPVQGAVIEESVFREHKRFLGYIPFNPYYVEEIKNHLPQLFTSGFYVGFKLLAGYWGIPIDDGRFTAVWEYADRFSLPILIHTWGGAIDSPAKLSGIAAKYKNAVFIIAHTGGNDAGRNEAETLAQEHQNVMLEFCGSFCSHRLWQDTIKRIGCNRIIFGSDTGCHSQAWELGRLLSTPMQDDIFPPILAGNIEAILKKSNHLLSRKEAL